MNRVLVIGGGASGMLAALIAARNGADTTILEKNEKLGKKIYITGKGRCNLTNACDRDTFFENVVSNPKFLYSAYSAFDNVGIVKLLEEGGVKCKKERGGRVFPVSDHASDVTAGLKRLLEKEKVKIRFNTEVSEILTEEVKDPEGVSRRICGLKLSDGQRIEAEKVIVCTGGLSYPSTGSTGFGLEEAARLGLTVTDTSPALVPFNIRDDFALELQGLALKNVSVRVIDHKNKCLYSGFGEMLFTHFGVSGPLMLTASSHVLNEIGKKHLSLRIDLKPAIDAATIDKRLVNLFAANRNKHYKSILKELLPHSMIPCFARLSGIDGDRPVNEITKTEREGIVVLLKSFPLTLTSIRGYDEAVITHGGVSVKEINPKTMESKKIKGLYFAGEVLDVDAHTGGFNLQIAWSTGYTAGLSAGKD